MLVLGVSVLRPGVPAKKITSAELAIDPSPTVLTGTRLARITSTSAKAADSSPPSEQIIKSSSFFLGRTVLLSAIIHSITGLTVALDTSSIKTYKPASCSCCEYGVSVIS